jgi:hypothetical protein
MVHNSHAMSKLQQTIKSCVLVGIQGGERSLSQRRNAGSDLFTNPATTRADTPKCVQRNGE